MEFAILVFLKLLTIVLVKADQQVPCYFIFGDSLVDNGNNNFLAAMAKANYPPYGIDFPRGSSSTGRFTNGPNIADIIAKLVGFPDYIPPFAAAPISSNITKGVNYGSGGAGIRDKTGKELGDVISFNRQLANHRIVVSLIGNLLGGRISAEEYLGKCLYTVGLGNNDYLNNYLMPEIYPTSRIYAPDQYAAVLIQQYSKQLVTLYNYGARKVAVFGVGLLGCIPAQLAMHNTNGIDPSPNCVDSVNFAVQLFNNRLKPLVDDLNNKLSGANFIFINISSILSADPSSLGIKVANASCCIVSTTIGKGLCSPGGIPCTNRSEYFFYDNFHPTEVVNRVTANRAYSALLTIRCVPD